MPDAPSTALDLPPPVSGWLQPLDGDPAGPNLEYEPEFLELATAAAGKPESTFAAAEPPNWLRARDLAEDLFKKTRDLRVAMWWARAMLNLEGFVALPAAIALMRGLIDRFWDGLHPMPDPDDGDTFARLAVIGGFDKLDSLLGDVRQSMLSTDPRMGGLRVRDVEVATQRIPAREGEAPRTAGQISGMLGDAPEIAAEIERANRASQQNLVLMQKLLGERFSLDMGVDLKVLSGMLAAVQSVIPGAPAPDEPVDGTVPEAGGGPARQARASGVHSVESRHDAIRAIELVCAYLERSEPTNPAQFLLRRAARVIGKDFLQLVHDLAPDALREVARIMGVDPSTVKDQN
ncbi:MAG: type VI secretion system ImpA family N-terminal domain-containing protein [Rubrivivax sp.]|nr:type VI secretion system ImpA family N-terminal domain-containing protein [Rubrivivax sp.]